jgi:hypothetical protein
MTITIGIFKHDDICFNEHFESPIKKINSPSKYIGDFPFKLLCNCLTTKEAKTELLEEMFR